MKKLKYGNKKCIYQGLKFDSILERDRWIFLLGCQKLGLISDLRRQDRYPLMAGDVLICTYLADFDYRYKGEWVTEDCKGVLTDVFRIKAKLFKAFYLRDIQIIDKDNVTNLVPVKKKRKSKK